MTVYIEDCLIENFAVTFLLLKCMTHFLKVKISKLRLICACSSGAVVATFYPLLYFNGALLFIFKCLVGVVIVCLAFNKGGLLFKYLLFMGLTALYGGLNILIYYAVYGTLNVTDNFPTYILLVLLFIIYYLTVSCLKIVQKKFVISNFVYDIEIYNNENKVQDVAFLDSGNTLIDTDSSPIFIINFKLFNKLYKDIGLEDILSKNFSGLKDAHYVKSSFASGSSKILVFSVDEMFIKSNAKNMEIKNAKLGLVYSKFNKNFNCNMLLNINCFL